jgi:glutathione S-transferase
LLLADRGTPHEFTEYTLDDWQEYVKTKEFSAEVPYAALPVLKDASNGLILPETGAILAYLDGLVEKKEVNVFVLQMTSYV